MISLILEDVNDKYLLDQVQDGSLSWISLTWPSTWLSKVGISANLNDILDELDTILDDPYDRYLSWTWTLIAWPSTT